MVRVVLHPMMPPGVPEELEAVDGIDLIRPDDVDGVTAALGGGGDVLVTYRWRDEFLQPSLRWIASISAGVDQYPLDQLDRRGVLVTSARGVNAIPVAEHAMALLLGCTRRIGQSTREATVRSWIRRPSKLELFGATTVILGLGTIGEEIARRAKAFDMSVVGIKRHPERYDGIVEDVRPPEALIDSCRDADVLICAAPGGAATRHLINADVIDALGRGVLVNVGRGSILDESALVAALQERRLLAAGLDVFEHEPLPDDSPLWDLPTLVLTPHIGGTGPRYGERWVQLFRGNIEAYRGDGSWTNLMLPRGPD